MEEAAASLGCTPWLSGFNIYLESPHTTHLAETCRTLTPCVCELAVPSGFFFFFHM